MILAINTLDLFVGFRDYPYNTYQCARGGIAFGFGYLPDGSGNEYYASNYNAEELKGQFYDGTTFVNYPEATTA